MESSSSLDTVKKLNEFEDEDEDENKHYSPSSWQHSAIRWAKFAPAIAIGLSIAILSLPPLVLLFQAALGTRSHPRAAGQRVINYKGVEPPNPSQWLVLDCGESKAEALAKGCVWAPRETGWISPRCIDPEGATYWQDTKEEDGVLDWYWDQAGRERITEEELYFGNISDFTPWEDRRQIYVPWRHHYLHCDYSLRVLAMALSKGTAGLAEKNFNGEHTSHCIDALTGKGKWPKDSMVPGYFGFRNCFVEVSPKLF